MTDVSSKLEVVLTLLKRDKSIFEESIHENFEVGRRQTDEPPEPSSHRSTKGILRLIVAAIDLRSFPRQLLRVEFVSNTQLKLINLHELATIRIVGYPTLAARGELIVTLPVTILLPEGYSLKLRQPVSVQPAKARAGTEVDDDWSRSLMSVSLMLGSRKLSDSGATDLNLDVGSGRFLTDMAFDPENAAASQASGVLSWLEYALAAMQRPASTDEFYYGIAEAVARIIDVDRAEVILWDGKFWDRDPRRTFINENVNPGSLQDPSSSMLHRARTSRQLTVYPDKSNEAGGMGESLRSLNAAVACPILDIFGGGEEILGVLYADRRIGKTLYAQEVNVAEQKLIAILATAIASSIAKANREKLVAKYQQFFSTKVTEAIRRNPALLAGEDADVSVLFCDIRGFSRETDRIGPAKAMEWVSDTLSELSEEVLQSDGVLVDYVGDELFAMWGAPEKTDDYALRAVKTAQCMMRLRAKLSDRYRLSIPNGVDFGIGVCTGPARVGNTGSKQKFKYGPLGRTVNLGSRIQGLTKQWKVGCLIEEKTESQLPPEVLRRRICQAQVVGLEGSINLFELMPENDDYHRELVEAYQDALDLFESGTQARKAASAFGALAQKYPHDGPSLVMLVRAVHEVVDPSQPFDPVWQATSK
jgi:adenylate cyclase